MCYFSEMYMHLLLKKCCDGQLQFKSSPKACYILWVGNWWCIICVHFVHVAFEQVAFVFFFYFFLSIRIIITIVCQHYFNSNCLLNKFNLCAHNH